MGRPRKYPLPADPVAGESEREAEPEQSGFVLARNTGIVIRGKSHWWPAGHRFDAEADAGLVSALHRAGVLFR